MSLCRWAIARRRRKWMQWRWSSSGRATWKSWAKASWSRSRWSNSRLCRPASSSRCQRRSWPWCLWVLRTRHPPEPSSHLLSRLSQHSDATRRAFRSCLINTKTSRPGLMQQYCRRNKDFQKLHLQEKSSWKPKKWQLNQKLSTAP